jgi:Na+/H+-dicarboxylate symporter
MSSVAALPLSIVAAEQNIKDSNLAKLLMPSTVNIHTIGSAIGMTTLMLTTSVAFTGSIPDLNTFIVFALFWSLAKFAVAAVPGGAVIVAAPLMAKYLGFSGDMIGLLTVAYMFFDPFGTATNVLGNGAFAIIFSKMSAFFKGEHKVTEVEIEEALEPEAYTEDEAGHELPVGEFFHLDHSAEAHEKEPAPVGIHSEK